MRQLRKYPQKIEEPKTMKKWDLGNRFNLKVKGLKEPNRFLDLK